MTERPGSGHAEPVAARDARAPLPGGEAQAILSLVLGATGVTAFCCFAPLSLPLSIVGVVMGLRGLGSSQRPLAVAGLIVNGLVLFCGLAFLAVLAFGFVVDLTGD